MCGSLGAVELSTGFKIELFPNGNQIVAIPSTFLYTKKSFLYKLTVIFLG
jgi:hypothetical protein